MIIKPQPGFQEQFLSSEADVVFGGGAAGAGKSFALLIEPLRHIDNPGFTPVFFRRTTKQIRTPGGIWETGKDLFKHLGAQFKESMLQCNFPSGAFMQFAHLEYEKDTNNWQGSQLPYIAFDELTHFTWKMFIDMLSRNRSMCGVRPYIRATCNPDPDSWVCDFIDWWIGEDGFIIKERSGVIRYFTIDGDNVVWGDTKKEVLEKCPHKFQPIIDQGYDPLDLVKSFTFIDGTIYDNQILLNSDPGYLGNLLALTENERKRLLDGNWKVKLDGLLLADHDKITDIFTNQIPTSNDRYIIIDHARQGQDLMTHITWEGWRTARIDILTKSDTNDIVKTSNTAMREYRIGSSAITIDQDGIGVKDHYRNCDVFMGGSRAIGPNRKIYKNLKTECTYYLCEEIINKNLLYVDLSNVYVDGKPSQTVKVGTKEYKVKDLILRQLRTLRSKDIDRDGKKQIESKEEQKNKLNGMSPDFSDNFLMRAKRDLRGKPRKPRRKN